MYEKMKDLKLNDSNIKQVKIDSITFVTNSTDQKLTFDNTLYGWKKEKYNPVNNYHYVDDPTLSFYLNIPNNNILVNSYAGCGKSYDIIHNVIPEIKEPFIVLTPSYASLSEYKKNNINCDVIQRFSNNNTVPTEKYIIVDEIGMVDRMGHYMLCKCREMNKQLYLYGDFNQLLPVNETKPLNASHYMNHLALQSKILNQNQRNNFTIEYYDQLINMTRKNAQLNVKKHSHILPTTDEQWDDDLTIICHRNIMVQKYNKYVLQLIDKSKYDIGVKIRCTSNKLIKKNALNNFKYIIIDNDKKSILKIVPHDQKYDNSQIITISYSEYEQNFDVAYALTIYSLQGSFVYKYHFAIEDYAYIDGRMAYTIISRIYEEKNIL
jgi:ATP-dependent exoDNAse (exonuclease V) alpha subunit